VEDHKKYIPKMYHTCPYDFSNESYGRMKFINTKFHPLITSPSELRFEISTPSQKAPNMTYTSPESKVKKSTLVKSQIVGPQKSKPSYFPNPKLF
jgi:hypothetical protein